MVTYVSEKKKVYQYKNPDDSSKNYSWGSNEAGCAGIIYGYKKRKPNKERLFSGLINAYYTSKTLKRIRPNLSGNHLERDVKLFSTIEKDYLV